MATPTVPPPTTIPATPAGRTVSRADILALGRSGKRWEFLRLAAQALSAAAHDVEIRFMAAANLGQLGLGTLAKIELDALPGEVRQDPQVLTLREAVGRLPSDEIPPGWLVTTCGHNLVALRNRGQCLGLDTTKWTEGLARWRFCRALDGNIVRAPGNDPDLSHWLGLLEQVGSARNLAATNIKPEDEFRAPITVEGIDPPWQLVEIARAAAPSRNGYQTPIRVVQADEREFLDGLAQVDMTELLAQERVSVFVGTRAGERLAEYLASRNHTRLDGAFVSLFGTRKRLEPTVQTVVENATRAQEAEAQRLAGVVETKYRGRDGSWWRERYRAALSGTGKPLRVLIPTCRYSTFVVHASNDLAAAVERAGHQARVLMDTDDCSTLSSVAYRGTVAEFEPDLVVLVNYPRHSMPGAFPDNVPYIAWLQDPMPHLFDPAAGAAMGELDFLAGCLFPELFEKFGYPACRALPVPVVACARKFSAEPAPEVLRERHGCEIAYVSHHSPSAEELHATIRGQAANAPAVQRAFDRIFAVLPSVLAGSMEMAPYTMLAKTAREHTRLALGGEPDERTATMILRNYALPVAERMFRHESLGWAAEIARRRGWRLHIYGRGWEKHPAFAPFAKGELEHGEGLRASYQGARVHLHMSLTTLMHQRVLECALAGGMPLCRMHRDAISGLKARAQLAAIAGGEPAVVEPARVGYALADFPEGMAMAAQLQRLGYDCDRYIWIAHKRLENLRRLAPVIDAKYDASWLLGDLAGTTFWDRQTLEERLGRAIGEGAWRESVSGGIAGRVRRELTHDSLFGKLVAMVAGSLNASARAGTTVPEAA